MSVHSFNLNTTEKLPPAGKENMCFQIDGKSAQAARYVKYRIMTKVIYCVISIYEFEQQYVVIKGMLQLMILKYHTKTIGIDQLLSNSALFEHRCLQNIKKVYKRAGKCDGQQQLRHIIDAGVVYTSEGFTNNSPRYSMTPTP